MSNNIAFNNAFILFFFCTFILLILFLRFFFFHSENRFICECRLRWIFDLHNQTKNRELKQSLERITCTLEHTPHVINDNSLNDPRYQIHFETSPRYSQPLNFDVHNDLSVQSNHLDQQQQQRNNPKQPHTSVTETVELLNLNPHKLPCEAVTDPTELPLQRESVSGLDIAGFKLFSSSDVSQMSSCMATTVLVLMAALILS